MESIEKKQDMGIRKVILVLSGVLFAIGFWLFFVNVNLAIVMHVAGFIGLGWSMVLRKIHEEDKLNITKE